jgi:uncharacterized repeat protein (TIGR03843 family)
VPGYERARAALAVVADVDRLRDAPFEVVGQFAHASNATLLVKFTDGSEDLAVYKPQRGEAPLWDFPEGTLHRREVAAYVVSELLGWGLVPETVLREDGPFGVGSVQRFVQHDPNRHYFALLEEGRSELLDQLRKMVVFDLVIDNADRKGGHVLVEEVEGGVQLRLVDHGVSFNVERKLRTVAWDFAGQPVPPALCDAVTELVGRASDVRQALTTLLSPVEIGVLLERMRAIADLQVFPEPIGPRPFPWPLV